MEVAKRLEKVAWLLILVWLVSVFSKGYLGWVSKMTGEALGNVSDGGEFLLVAGIVYVISQIFKRGIEIQEENQLTV